MRATSDHIQQDQRRLRAAITLTAWFVATLWAIRLLEDLSGLDLGSLGILPRHLSGLVGVFTAPLIHASYAHLLTNTPVLLVLGSALLYGYPRSALVLLPAVYFGSGTAVWLFARPAYHIGASGLAFGIFFFVITVGALRRDRLAIALCMVALFLYGSMIWGILPGRPQTSFESHFFGAVIGLVLAFVLKDHDPKPPEKTYDWEGEDQDSDTDWERFTK
jgi:membrane associated rhomboid family serine protease